MSPSPRMLGPGPYTGAARDRPRPEARRELASGEEAGVLPLMTDVGNTASQAVAVRAGFTREAVLRSCLEYRDGSRGDAVVFSRLPED